LRDKFSYLDEAKCSTFSVSAFERFYPEAFDARVSEVLSIQDRKERQGAKLQLLLDVLAASKDGRLNEQWSTSASDVIDLLRTIRDSMGDSSERAGGAAS
jgi:Holliday junction resolvase RusA-like endonuclease